MTPQTTNPALLDIEAQVQAEARRAARIAAQNDAFRHVLLPGAAPCPLAGRVAVTRSVAARGSAFMGTALVAVATDGAFTEQNDPDGDHGFGAVDVEGVTVWWKLDLYDADYHLGSERPNDPKVTARVLTILLPEDY